MAEDTVDLWGTVVKTSNPTYQRLLAKGYNNEQITSAFQKSQTARARATTPTAPATNPVANPTEVAPVQPVVPQDTTATDMQSTPIKQVPKKETTTTTKETKQPEPLPVSDYLDDTEIRQANIINNLNQARLTNPQSLKTEQDFRQYYNYEWRSELQKKTLDNWYKWFTTGKQLSLKSPNDLLSMYDAGTITATDLDNINVASPEKYNEVIALIDKKEKMNKYATSLYGEAKAVNPLQSMIDQYVKWLQTFAWSTFYQDYKNAVNSDVLKWQNKKIIDQQTEMDKIDLEITNKENEIKKRYEWNWAKSSKINAIIADETRDLQNMKSNIVIDTNWLINQYNSQMWAIKDEFEMREKEEAMKTQARTQQMTELWFAMNLMSYETPDQQEEREWNKFIRQQEYTDWNIYSNDPATRKKAVTKAVENVLTEFAWIPITRSKEQIVSDIQGLVDGGMDLWEAITKNLRQPIMDKPEYKKIMNDKFGISTDKSLIEIWWQTYLMDKEWNFTAPNLPWAKVQPSWNIVRTTLNGKNVWLDNITVPSITSAFEEINSQWLWKIIVWEWHRDQAKTIKAMWDRVGMPWASASELRAAGHQIADVWKSDHETGMAIDIYSEWMKAPTPQQVAVLNKNWRFQTVWTWDMGHFEYLWVQSWWWTTTKTTTWWSNYNISYAWLYRKANEWKLTKEDYSQINWMWFTTKDFISQAQTWRADQVKQWNTEVMDAINSLINDYPWRTKALLADTSAWQFVSSDLADFKSNFDLVRSKLTMDALVSLKDQWATFGALSDSERAAIWDSISALKLSNSEEQFISNLNKAKNILLRASKWSTMQSTNKTATTPKANLNQLFTQINAWFMGNNILKSSTPSYNLSNY